MIPLDSLWTYRCQVLRILDGDTIEITLDQGLRITRYERIRILGVNAPEMHGSTHEAGVAARLFVVDWCTAAGTAKYPFIIRTERADVFGRWLGVIWRIDTGESLGAALLAAGHAVPYAGRTP